MEVLRVGQMSITLYMTDPSIPSIFCLFFWKESQEMMLQQDNLGAPCPRPWLPPLPPHRAHGGGGYPFVASHPWQVGGGRLLGGCMGAPHGLPSCCSIISWGLFPKK